MKNLEIDVALTELLERYGISESKRFSLSNNIEAYYQLIPGYHYKEANQNRQIPLLFWRTRRSVLELKKIIDDSTIQDVCLMRSSHLSAYKEDGLRELVYQKLDVCEFISSQKIVSVFAVTGDVKNINIIATLSSGIICSIEICLNLPIGSTDQVRNEIIARRGVACDRVVDTQIQQHSIYCFSQTGNETYTDTDMELFGFNELEIELIRSGFEIAKSETTQSDWTKQHERLDSLVNAVFQSIQTGRKQIIE